MQLTLLQGIQQRELLYLSMVAGPIWWFSKPQNTVESSTFWSEFVALKIATELNDELQYKLHTMFGVPIDGPTIPSVTIIALYKMLQDPSPFSKKKHNSIAYHKVHESMTTNSLHVLHEPGNTNLADVFTKLLPPIKQWQVVNACHGDSRLFPGCLSRDIFYPGGDCI